MHPLDVTISGNGDFVSLFLIVIFALLLVIVVIEVIKSIKSL